MTQSSISQHANNYIFSPSGLQLQRSAPNGLAPCQTSGAIPSTAVTLLRDHVLDCVHCDQSEHDATPVTELQCIADRPTCWTLACNCHSNETHETVQKLYRLQPLEVRTEQTHISSASLLTAKQHHNALQMCSSYW